MRVRLPRLPLLRRQAFFDNSASDRALADQRSGRHSLKVKIVGSNPTQGTDGQVVERQTRQVQSLVPTGREGSSPSLVTDRSCC
jgi:hypothetical protein